MSNVPPPTHDYQTPPGYIPFATPAAPRRSFGRGLFGWLLFIGLMVMLFVVLKRDQGKAYELSLNDLRSELDNGNLKSIVIEGDELSGQFVTPPSSTSGSARYRTVLPAGTAGQWTFVQWLLDHGKGANVVANNNTNLLAQFILPLVPWLLIFGFVWFFIFRQLRKSGTQPVRPAPVYIVNPEQRQP
jgi:ATP-dependent Zn protease